MKNRLYLILVLLALSLSNIAYASNDKKDVPMERTNNRTKDTSIGNLPICHYDNGALHISFAMPEGKATLTVTHLDSGEKNKETFLTYRPYTTWIGSNTGMYQIELDTTHGGKYIGYLTID